MPLSSSEEENRLYKEGVVRLTTGEMGIEIKWSVFSPCFSSLFTAMNWLPTAEGPFMLRYYLSGWFEEIHQTHETACLRIDQIIAKSDIHLTKRTFVREFNATDSSTPSVLREGFLRAAPIADHSIECVLDESSRQFRVERIGSKSAVARVYGTVLASFPCKNGNSYDRIVSEAYNDVIATGRPRYDQVIASMCAPDNTQHWLSYHRVIFPSSGLGNRASVSVMSEVADVGFRII